MAMKDTIQTDMVSAMKSGDKLRLNTLRSVLGAITDAETAGKSRSELTDSDVITVLKKLVKTRRESAVIYTEAGATDRADQENAEASIIEEYLPAQLDEDALRKLISDIIDEKDLADAGPRGIGMVMKELKGRDDVDAAVASKITRELL